MKAGELIQRALSKDRIGWPGCRPNAQEVNGLDALALRLGEMLLPSQKQAGDAAN